MDDMLLDSEGDLELLDGDFVLGNSEAQHLELLLKSAQGQWKEYPELGVNLNNAQGGVIDRFLKRNIRIQLEADGFALKELTITENGIDITGNYGTTTNV